jgi:hypothetical protein
MGSYTSTVMRDGGKVSEKRAEFKAGVLLAARHEWVACVWRVRTAGVSGVSFCVFNKDADLEVTISDTTSTPQDDEILTELAEELRKDGKRIHCVECPEGGTVEAIVFSHSVDRVEWSDAPSGGTSELKVTMKVGVRTVDHTFKSAEPDYLARTAGALLATVYPTKPAAPAPAPAPQLGAPAENGK